jgi:FkbM family methyltransferase
MLEMPRAPLATRARRAVKRVLASRYTHAGLGRALIYALLSVRFARLAARPADRARVVAATVVLALAEARGGSVRPRCIPVDYAGRRYELTIGGCNDLDVLKSLLLDGDYGDLRVRGEPDAIVDLGSHIGASLIAFHARWPRAKLLGAEPDPAVFARLRENVRALGDVIVRNVAVAGQDGTVAFYVWRDAWGSSMFPSERASERIDVPAVTLRELLRDAGVAHVGLLKLNIEGAELGVIRSFEDWPSVDQLVVEWHGEYLTPSELREAEAILREHFELHVQPVAARPGDYVIVGHRRRLPSA